ncbi:hypothetical protein CCAX7_54940 [Capsulimonas corticalis]|uniref:Uncharacterized protein n=2 Tax=Capsulimonas corticalis TaxID=2219043 RepID=A0A402D5R3_9BACT|nr:hypothetical protein CCAX7_54940 [Capsulimonas corticalis]
MDFGQQADIDLAEANAAIEQRDQALEQAQQKIRDLEAQIEDNRRTHTKDFNAIWEIVYPGHPGLWDYPGMVVRHIKAFLEEKQILIDDLVRMLRDERALRTPPEIPIDKLDETAHVLLAIHGFTPENIQRMHPRDYEGYLTDADRLLCDYVLLTRAEHNELLRHARTPDGVRKRMADMADALLALNVGEALEAALDQPTTTEGTVG